MPNFGGGQGDTVNNMENLWHGSVFRITGHSFHVIELFFVVEHATEKTVEFSVILNATLIESVLMIR